MDIDFLVINEIVIGDIVSSVYFKGFFFLSFTRSEHVSVHHALGGLKFFLKVGRVVIDLRAALLIALIN